MAGKQENKGIRKDRFTWKAGDVIVTDRNGNLIDLNKLAKQAKEAAAKPKKKK